MDFKKNHERRDKARSEGKISSSSLLRPPPGFSRHMDDEFEIWRQVTMSDFLEPSPGFVGLFEKDKDPIQSFVERSRNIFPSTNPMNQLGLSGLLSSLKAADTNPSLQTLVLGIDLEEMELEINEDKVKPSVCDTVAKNSSSPLNLQYPVPQEYPNMANLDVKEKLPEPKLRDCTDEWLFCMFYMFPAQDEQMLAAVFLYEREWRFHREKKVWIKRLQGMSSIYHVFDAKLWKKVTKILDMDNECVECNPLLSIVTSLDKTIENE